jgi:hypothetical protein
MCHHHGLKGVGPNYSEPPPENGKRFIVKVQQAYDQFDLTSISLVIYDRSLTISESFQSIRPCSKFDKRSGCYLRKEVY